MTRLIWSVLLLCVFVATGMSQNEPWRNRKDLPGDFPVPPQIDKRLFYLQRNLNANTIVYDLNCLPNGNINPKEPIKVYWLRYSSTLDGVKKDLKWVEKKFAYGYNSKKNSNGDGFLVELVAYDERKIHLKKNGNGEFLPYMEINGKNCLLTNIYVYADNSEWWPDVIHVDIYGKDLQTGQKVFERFLN